MRASERLADFLKLVNLLVEHERNCQATGTNECARCQQNQADVDAARGALEEALPTEEAAANTKELVDVLALTREIVTNVRHQQQGQTLAPATALALRKRAHAELVMARYPTDDIQAALELLERTSDLLTLEVGAIRLPGAPVGPPVDVVAAVRRSRIPGEAWVCRRTRDGAHAGLAGMWEYPGGKVEPSESHPQALRREMREEFGVDVCVGPLLDRIESRHGDTVYAVHFYEITIEAGEPQLRVHDDAGWFGLQVLQEQQHLPSGTEFNRRQFCRYLASLARAAGRADEAEAYLRQVAAGA